MSNRFSLAAATARLDQPRNSNRLASRATGAVFGPCAAGFVLKASDAPRFGRVVEGRNLARERELRPCQQQRVPQHDKGEFENESGLAGPMLPAAPGAPPVAVGGQYIAQNEQDAEPL